MSVSPCVCSGMLCAGHQDTSTHSILSGPCHTPPSYCQPCPPASPHTFLSGRLSRGRLRAGSTLTHRRTISAWTRHTRPSCITHHLHLHHTSQQPPIIPFPSLPFPAPSHVRIPPRFPPAPAPPAARRSLPPSLPTRGRTTVCILQPRALGRRGPERVAACTCVCLASPT